MPSSASTFFARSARETVDLVLRDLADSELLCRVKREFGFVNRLDNVDFRALDHSFELVLESGREVVGRETLALFLCDVAFEVDIETELNPRGAVVRVFFVADLVNVAVLLIGESVQSVKRLLFALEVERASDLLVNFILGIGVFDFLFECTDLSGVLTDSVRESGDCGGVGSEPLELAVSVLSELLISGSGVEALQRENAIGVDDCLAVSGKSLPTATVSNVPSIFSLRTKTESSPSEARATI